MTRKGSKPKRASQSFSNPGVFEPRLEFPGRCLGNGALFDDLLVCA
jgi:hypothetical protein